MTRLIAEDIFFAKCDELYINRLTNNENDRLCMNCDRIIQVFVLNLDKHIKCVSNIKRSII